MAAATRTPLLTDILSLNRLAAMAENVRWRGPAELMEPKLSRDLALRDALRPVAFRNGTSASGVAVAWTPAWQGKGMHP
jgi:hypothetical protein